MATAPVIDTPELRKARGAFFTPPAVARHLTEWAVRSPHDRVLEPSCGEAAFLTAAARRLQRLGHTGDMAAQLRGVELHADSAETARRLVTAVGGRATVQVADFFDVAPTGDVDAVVGNPPYVRYQDFTGRSRSAGRAAALAAGVRLSALASSWAAFVVYSALFLRRGGRLGLVIPAEVLSVNYAAPVRRFLLEEFAELQLVLFEERVFPGVLEEVVLVMADGYRSGRAGHATITQVRSAEALGQAVPSHRWTPDDASAKWTASMLRADARDAYAAVAAGGTFAPLGDWGETTLGAVTGNNAFFCLSPQRADELRLGADELVPLSPPGSRHLRGLSLTATRMRELGAMGRATSLFRPAAEPSAAARRYIQAGHRAGVDLAYKCRVRTPWWRVPLVPPPDLFLTYMNADTPRLTSNRARAHHLNSVHGVYLAHEAKALGGALLPVAALNSTTLLSAELVGRSYGGGMLKIEPREADALLVPSLAVVRAAATELRAVRPGVRRALASGDLLAATVLVDDALGGAGFALAPAQLDRLRAARRELHARRVARGAEPAGGAP
ncbi:Eco57I restriction-modification methylase domain-containing protein [Microbacterium sp.]|uniref:Eco57I restriction-modification methylase domain-containing protein n=1 Tax=Microbacterium sp. TaxID=51671 RepID=UPI0039E5935F